MAADPRRPGYHLTAPTGWINDPLGVTWHGTPEGGRYELFFQFNPAAPVWAPECRWGQAHSADLVRWRDVRTALEPGPEESGCWSGSVVVGDDGTPVIVYTSVLAEDPGQGRIALATGDASWRRWTPGAGPVLAAPAPDRGLAHFRDPFLWRDGDRWRMAVGAGSAAGVPSVLQFSSPDLQRWTEDGVLAEPGDGRAGPGGSVWECPQLFRLDGAWVLMVSVWDEVPGGVACAVGDYDGRRFTARAWHRLAADPLYATTTFLDAAGRRCAMSWVQEAGPAAGAWAGTLTVPWLLVRDGDRVGVRPHPDVDSLRTRVVAEAGPVALAQGPLDAGAVGACCDIALEGGPGDAPWTLALRDDDGPLVGVAVDPAAGTAELTARGRGAVALPLRRTPDGGVALRLLLDTTVAELFLSGGAVAAARTQAPVGAVTLTVSGAGAALRTLVVHGMERALDRP